MNLFSRYGLVVYLIIFVFAVFILPSYRVWRATSKLPVTFGSGDNAHDLIGRLFKFLFTLVGAMVIVHALSENLYEILTPISWLKMPFLLITGWLLLLTSLAWVISAQVQMGQSWHIGIPTGKDQTTLVTTGVFRLSRNPVFLGMTITLTGLFMILPNAVSLFVLGQGIVLIQIQVRLEETYLDRTYGERYAEYRRHVPRWL